eukprot:757703-Hanusia_phi.AAC.1
MGLRALAHGAAACLPADGAVPGDSPPPPLQARALIGDVRVEAMLAEAAVTSPVLAREHGGGAFDLRQCRSVRGETLPLLPLPDPDP